MGINLSSLPNKTSSELSGTEQIFINDGGIIKDITVTELATKIGLNAVTDISSKANISGATFTGAVYAPSPSADANDTQVATTEFVKTAISGLSTSSGGVASVSGRTGSVTLTKSDVSLSNVDNTSDSSKAVSVPQQSALNLKANIDSPTFVGAPLAPTAVSDTNNKQIATTEFVKTAIASIPLSSGVVNVYDWAKAINKPAYTAAEVGLANVNNTADVNKPVSSLQQSALNLKAPLTSPVFTGIPIGPTAAVNTNTSQLATTSFVNAEIANDAPSKTGVGASGTWGISTTGNAATATKLVTPRNINGIPFDGTADITLSIDNSGVGLIPSSEKGMPLGVATLDATGVIPSAQLPSYVDDVLEYANFAALPVSGATDIIYVTVDDNKTYRWSGTVYTAITSGAVTSVAGKTGVITLVKADVGLSQVSNTSDAAKPLSIDAVAALGTKANLASPTFTGIPAAPTATAGTNTTQLATTAFVKSAVDAVSVSGGGVTSVTGTGAISSTGGSTPVISISAASTSLPGSMSSTDKIKLDGIASGAQVNAPTNLSIEQTATNIVFRSSTGSAVAVPEATSSFAGVMSAADRIKLASLSTGGVTSVASKTGTVVLTKADVGLGSVDNTPDSTKPVSAPQLLALNLKANLAGPTFTAIPSAPTAATGTNNTQLATTAFVANAVSGLSGGTGAVSSVNTKTGAVVLTKADIGLNLVNNTADYQKQISGPTQEALYLKADLAGANFTSTPSAPTQTVNSNNTYLATTAFVKTQITNDAAPITHVGSGGTAHSIATTTSAGFLSSADKTKIDNLATNAVTSVASRTGAVVLTKSDVGLSLVDNVADAYKQVSAAQQTALNLKSNIESPSFTGMPRAATAAAGTNNTQLATTAFVANAVSGLSGGTGAVSSVNTKTGAVVLTKSDVGLSNVDNTTDAGKPVSTAQTTALNLKANLTGGTFTGAVFAPTAISGTNNTQLATTAFVQTVISGAAGAVTSVASRTGAVVLTKTDVGLSNVDNTTDASKPVSTAQNTAILTRAPLISPVFTGIPVAPTATSGTNTTQLATTAFVAAALSGVGTSSSGVYSVSITSPSFISTTTGTPTVSSNSNLNLSAVTRVQCTQSPFKLWNITTSVRDSFAASNGDMIYNTTTNTIQAYANGTWVNL